MRFFRYIAVPLAILSGLSCTREPLEDMIEEVTVEQSAPTARIHSVIVKVTEETARMLEADLQDGRMVTRSSEMNGFFQAYGVSSVSRVFQDDERYIKRQHLAGLHRWYRLDYDPSVSTVTKAAEDAANIPGVEIAEPERLVKPTSFDDEYQSNQWYIYQPSRIDINVQTVWDRYTKGSPEVVVAVLDEGIDLKHPDLVWNSLPGGVGKSKNFATGGYGITPGSHGSHVGGIIAATSNNGTGISGIAGGDYASGQRGATLMSLQCFDTDSQGYSIQGDFAEAMRYAADNGALISQNSWQNNYDYNGDGIISGKEYEDQMNAQVSSSMKAAIDYFIKYAGCDENGEQKPDSPMKGGIVIMAAGNEALANSAPANYPPVLAVGAVTSEGGRSSFSNFGDWVDICAPGSDIYSTVPGGYASMNGTSMACPVVSGVAALVISYRGGLGFTNDMLMDCLVKGANPGISAKRVGPMVDALGACLYGTVSAPAPITAFGVDVTANNADVSWTVPEGEPGTSAYGAVIFASKNKSSIEELDPKHPASDVKSQVIETVSNKVGDQVTGRISGLGYDSEYYITVVSFNYGGVFSAAPAPVRINTPSNHAPEVGSDIDTDGISLKASQTLNITFNISDPDGDSFSVVWKKGSDAETWIPLSAGKYTLRIAAPKVPAGSYTSTITVRDAYGMTSIVPVNYQVRENQAPVVMGSIENVLLQTSDKAGRQVDLKKVFSEPDGDFISYDLTNSSLSTAHVVVNSDVLYITPTASGRAQLTVTARDPLGASVSQSFVVIVRDENESVSVYPTQVKDFVNVGTGEKTAPAHVEIISQGGVSVYDATLDASVFDPARVDMTGIAPGRYVVRAEYEGHSVSKTIVKL